ncbi:hypothetical protein G5I_08353 [Acromyrmex echinatior]|uniref:Uncharacterized protein n=1 Tax=Acromyrmex echinatior TaxID=103372 RepID=F4WRA7_ACREC|nr:hypothetical protein G5I_08353 [Acromyrmex echinatior]
MEVHARAPDPLTIDGDMASNWQSWKEDFIIFMNLTGYIDKPNEIRANLLKNRIGKVGIDAIQNFSFDNVEDKDNMDILIEKLENYFNPPKKEVVERYNFFTRAKKQHESIEQYINILKSMNKNLLDPTTQQIKLNPKNNDKWNNQVDSEVKTKDSINKTIFPDVPTTNLNYVNTTNYSTHLPKKYSYSYTNLTQPGGTIFDLRNRGANVQPKQTKTPSAGTSQESISTNFDNDDFKVVDKLLANCPELLYRQVANKCELGCCNSNYNNTHDRKRDIQLKDIF